MNPHTDAFYGPDKPRHCLGASGTKGRVVLGIGSGETALFTPLWAKSAELVSNSGQSRGKIIINLLSIYSR